MKIKNIAWTNLNKLKSSVIDPLINPSILCPIILSIWMKIYQDLPRIHDAWKCNWQDKDQLPFPKISQKFDNLVIFFGEDFNGILFHLIFEKKYMKQLIHNGKYLIVYIWWFECTYLKGFVRFCPVLIFCAIFLFNSWAYAVFYLFPVSSYISFFKISIYILNKNVNCYYEVQVKKYHQLEL